MSLRDFFFFNKGEAIALTVLLGLIALAWIVIIYTDLHRPTSPQTPAVTDIRPDTIRTSREETAPPVQTASLFVEREKRTPSVRMDTRLRKGTLTYPKTEKYPAGTIVELNSADTTTLKKVPGIGSTFARRIVKYRDLLGGFYCVGQLGEVYGIDEERYEALKPWFIVDSSLIRPLPINQLTVKELARHPYVNYRQASAVARLIRQKRILQGWEDLILLEEFPEADYQRLRPYFAFHENE